MVEEDVHSEIEDENPFYSFYDLSFVEILTINELVKLSQSKTARKISILRHDLYKSINDLVKYKKKLSTSSFYRTLDKLRDRGFLEFKKSDNVAYRNAIEVYPTLQATQVIGFMMHFMVQFNSQTNTAILDYIENQLLQKLGEHIDPSQIRRLRIIKPNSGIGSPADLISSILPDAIGMMQILANEALFNSWGAAVLVNVLETKDIFHWAGRESDQADLVIFPLYDQNTFFRGRNHEGILTELHHVLTKEGYVLLIHLEEIKSDHHYVNVFKSFLRNSSYYQPFDSDKLEKRIHSLDYRFISKFGYRGVCFILMQKLS